MKNKNNTKKLKTWQIVMLVIFYPVGIIYFVLWLLKKKIKPSLKSNTQKTSTNIFKPKTTTISTDVPKKVYSWELPDGEKDYNLFENFLGDSILHYEYENNICLDNGAIEHIKGNGGKFLTFTKEPENIYDKNAVAIYLGDIKLGYIYRGTTQDMYNSYADKKGWSILGHINKYSLETNKATYKIAFYKPLSRMDSKQVALTKIKKVDEYTNRLDNILSCSEGDSVVIEYDDFVESFIVYNKYSDEIGELPKSAEDYLYTNKKYIGIIDSCNFENNKVKAQITVYYQ